MLEGMEMGMLGWCYSSIGFAGVRGVVVREGFRDSGHGYVMLCWVTVLLFFV